MGDSVTPEELAAMRRVGDVLVVDIRRQADLDETSIPGSVRGDPESVESWAESLPKDRTIVVYCVLGGRVSREVTPKLVARGLNAKYVEGGIEAWMDYGGETIVMDRSREVAPNEDSSAGPRE